MQTVSTRLRAVVIAPSGSDNSAIHCLMPGFLDMLGIDGRKNFRAGIDRRVSRCLLQFRQKCIKLVGDELPPLRVTREFRLDERPELRNRWQDRTNLGNLPRAIGSFRKRLPYPEVIGFLGLPTGCTRDQDVLQDFDIDERVFDGSASRFSFLSF